MSEPLTNLPEYTVAEISGAVKRTLEATFGRVRVRGEVTEVKRYASGHCYFSLKDEGGKLAVVAWKSVVPRLGLVPENGLEVIATGRLTAYGDRSTYQLLVERLEYAGEGAMLARIEALRRALAAEGLFDATRKRALPVLPRLIGVITSEQGAVIQDIRTTVLRRFPRPILLWPVPVQGEGAGARIAAAITGFNALSQSGAIPRPDILIVARGGGSLEDLLPFSDEAVVRAAAASAIPLIAAVGHETDWPLIDFAADRRAPTPTAAAELAVPVRADVLAELAQTAARLAGALSRLEETSRLRLERAARGLPDVAALVGAARQRLDDRAERLHAALPTFIAARRAELARGAARLIHPRTMLVASRAALALAWQQLQAGVARTISARRTAAGQITGRLTPSLLQAALREARARLSGVATTLASLSPDAVLARGYALVFDRAGHLLAHAREVKHAQPLRIRFSDGEREVISRGKSEPQGRLPL